jgi:predicted RecA/RadA family phage recombinase
MTAIFIQNGDALDHIPTTDLPLGAVVVQGALVGIAHRPIPAGALGSLAVEGVFELPSTPGEHAGTGAAVFWNPATNLATLDGAIIGVVRCGVLARPLAATDTTLRVLLGR